MTIQGRRVRRETHGERRTAWTVSQMALFGSPYRMTVAWGANGIGKSLAIAELAIRAIEGSLSWQAAGPQKVIVAGKTWMQIGSTLNYLWQMVDHRWFGPKVRFESGEMKGQRLKVYDIVAGPGRGGQLRLGVFNAENLAGPRADVVITDEPLPAKVYAELWPRLLGTNGRMYQTFTPTLGTADDMGYIWDMVDDPGRPWAGQIHTELTHEAVTPISSTGLPGVAWMTPREIEEFESGLPAMERDMRMGRSREPRRDEAYFSEVWGPHLLVDDPIPPRTPVGIGIDHGSKPGAQRAVMVAVSGVGEYARVWGLDEYRGDGRTESEDDAAGILDMLMRHGMTLADVDYWVGDRAHAGDHRGGKKSNQRLKAALAKATGLDPRRPGWSKSLPRPLQRMWVPRKYDGSMWDGMAVLHALMAGPAATPPRPSRMTVSPVCTYLDEDLRAWEGKYTDPHKDGLDACRYIVVPMLEGKHLDARLPRR